MNVDNAARPTPPPPHDDEYAWFRDGSMPPSREDRIAEIVALIALLFSLGMGLLVALQPLTPGAAAAAAIGGATRTPASGVRWQ